MGIVGVGSSSFVFPWLITKYGAGAGGGSGRDVVSSCCVSNTLFFGNCWPVMKLVCTSTEAPMLPRPPPFTVIDVLGLLVLMVAPVQTYEGNG